MACFSLIVGLSAFLALAFVLTGFVGYRQVLNQNACQMTYSPRPGQYPVLYNMSEWNYNLRKISNHANKKLNPQPVLFIPGHHGSHHQSRSFASELPDMHNEEQYFQYFSLDFNDGPVALHAGDVIDKAVFMNEALKAIRDLYEANQLDVQVMILAHSFGGMIARTGMLLSNHPKCMVDTIFMLSAPITRAPYGPDNTFQHLFHTVNKAWFTASYNTTSACIATASAGLPSLESSKRITLNQHCPSKCVRKARIVNIAGGDLDLLVPIDSTDLFELSARPRNGTLLSLSGSKTRVYTLDKYFQIKDTLKKYFVQASQLVVNIVQTVSSLANNSSSNSSSSSSDAFKNETNLNGNTTETTRNLVIEEEEMEIEPTINNTQSPYAYITRSSWQTTIIPYQDPQHITIRSSQLQQVKFPIDHYAILWCHQVVKVIHQMMKKVSKFPVNEPLIWHEILPITASKRLQAAYDEVSILNLEDLNSFVSRNLTSYDLLHGDGEEHDDHYIKTRLSHPRIMFLAMKFFVHHLGQILSCVMGMILISISNHLLRGLMGDDLHSNSSNNNKSNTNKNRSKGQNYFLQIVGIDAYVKLFQMIFKAVRRNIVECSVIGVIVLAVVIGYAIRSEWLTRKSIPLILNTCLSLWVAIALKTLFRWLIGAFVFIMMWLILPVKIAIGLILYPLIFLQTWLSKKVKQIGMAIDIFCSYIYDFLAITLLLTIWVTTTTATNKKTSLVHLNRSNLIFCSSVICFYLLACGILLWTMAKKETTYGFPAAGGVAANHLTIKAHMMDFFALYLPSLALGIPSFLFAWKQLYHSHPMDYDLNEVYTLFGPARINFCLSLFAMYLHIRTSSNMSSFLSEMNGLNLLKDWKSTSSKKKISNPHCYHEDGGPRAILEPFDPNHPNAEQLVSIQGSAIVMGPTYRVISCDCAKNKELKTFEEWCEFCRCGNCGGKNIVRPRQSDTFGRDNNAFSINLDLLLWLVVTAVAGYVIVFSSDQLYINLHATGIVAAACYVRQCFSRDNISLRM